MLAYPNISTTEKLMGILPVYVGMEMILAETLLPPRYTPGAPVMVIGIELHKDEPSLNDRASLLEHGCVLLRFMPQCIYVKLKNGTDNFWGEKTPMLRCPTRTLQGSLPSSRNPDPGDSLPTIMRSLFTCSVCKYHCSLVNRPHCTEFKGGQQNQVWWLIGDSRGGSAQSLVGLRITSSFPGLVDWQIS
jgi:hypothetical protein